MVLITFFANFWVLERRDWTNMSITSEVSPRLGVGTLPPTRTLQQSTLLPTMDYDGNIDLLLAGSDDELVEEVQDLLIAEAIERFRVGRSACRLFKVHNEKVDWSAHVNALRHSKEFTRTYRIPFSAFVFLVDILLEEWWLAVVSVVAERLAAVVWWWWLVGLWGTPLWRR